MNTKLPRYIQLGLLALVAIMPFHAFLSVSLGHWLGYQALWQSWKEVLLVALGLLSLIWLSKDARPLQRLKQPLFYLVAGYIGLGLLVTLFVHPEWTAVGFGLKTDFEFLIAFTLATLVCTPEFLRQILKVLVVSAGVVIAFGLAQIFLLPADWLTQFGYGPNTVPAYLRVDPAIEAVRIVGTLGGPNQLGSFLILPVALVAWKFLTEPRWWHLIYIATGLTILYHTYSRAAYIGIALAIIILIMFRMPRIWRMPLLLGATVVAALTLQFMISNISRYPSLQYHLFHQGVQTTNYQASTDEHKIALVSGWERIADNPLGLGLGSAGPASFYSSEPFIPESFYLQIAVETGVLGLILFLLIQLLLGWKLGHRRNILAPAALCALIGIGAVNLFLHGWADSSTALVYWTSAGAALGAKS